MKKKVIAVLLTTCLVFTGCGPKTVESQKEVVVDQNQPENSDELPDQTATEASEEEEISEETASESTTGEVQQGDGFTKTPIITNKELNYTGVSGPMEYKISAIQISNLKATTDEAAEMFGIEKDKDVAVVALDVSIENTSDDNVSFYFDQAALTTNTKEQVDPNFLFSDYIDGEYLGNVVHSGTIIYLLPNSTAEDLTQITLHVSGPIDEDWNNLDEDFTIDLSFE